MTSLRSWPEPTGLHHGDHACWTYADPAELSSAVLPFLDEGRRQGEQLVLTGGSRAQLLEAVRPLPDRDALLASGQLQVRETAELYESGRELDPAAQVRALGDAVDAALRRGRPGLRIAADITALAQHPEDRWRLHAYEGLVDDLFRSAPLTAMCLYDAALGDDVLGPLVVLHPLQHHGDREPLGHLSGGGPRLALHGEVDTSVAGSVLPALLDLARATPGEVVLDLSDLDFLDVAGARALRRAARTLAGAGVGLRLVGGKRIVARSLELFDLPMERDVSA